MSLKFMVPILLLSMLFNSLTLAMEDITHSRISKVDGSESTYKVSSEDGTEYRYVTFINEQEYQSIVDSNFKWLNQENILPIATQHFEINSNECIYLDTEWSAIATPHSPYPILVTSYVYNCVTLALISSQKIGMFHIYPEDKEERVTNFIKYFMDRNIDEVTVLLITGQLSPNLSRCHHILQESNLNRIHAYYLKVIQLTTSNHETLYHSTLIDKDKLLLTPSIIGDLFTKVAIDARTGAISLDFDIAKFEREMGDRMDRANKASQEAGMEIKFSYQDWGQ